MSKHFINTINIKNFKCFNDFNASGFSQVNLIGGKNNIGKTAFMEACFINTNSINIKSLLTALYNVKFMRENINILFNDIKPDGEKFIERYTGIIIKSNINNISYSVDENNGIKQYRFILNGKETSVNVKDLSIENTRLYSSNFIDNFGLHNSEITHLYAAVQKKDKEEYLNNTLKQFDPRIETFKIIQDSPQCKINQQYLELTEFGDGLRHLVSIVISLYASENGYLFIDEVDNGIHYTKLDEIWRILLTLATELNVQVFATTHSKECIDAFNRVQLEKQHQQALYIEMARNKKTDAIFMRSLDHDQLQYELNHQGKYRGE